ncbi:MAG: hypothetical protein WBV36_07015 [Terriglobales bacterium]
MRQVSSRGYRFIFPMLATLMMCVAAFSQSQSLGDIARENREKKAAEESSSTPPKVITNKNLPKDPDAGSNSAASATAPAPNSNSPFAEKTAEQPSTEEPPTQRPSAAQRSAERLPEQQAAQQRASERRAAVQWRKRILQQEITVANLRMRADHLRAAMHLANVNTYNGMPFDRYQAQQMHRLSQVQYQLDQQQRKLEDMQEAARHAGMHTLVYDPQ